MCFAFTLSQSGFYTFFCLTCFCLFCFSYKKFKKKLKNKKKYKNSVCFVYIGTCIPWMAIETKFFELCIFCRLDEHLYV